MNFISKSLSAIALSAATLAVAAADLRPVHYLPQGHSAVTTDGTARFNRGLYGAHSGFRVDCSDMPEFGIYLPRMGGNLKLTLPAGKCTARYTPGRMDYEQGGVEVEAQVLRSSDMALWTIRNTTGRTVEIPVRFGGVADKKFYREGDLGVDAPDCFDLKPEYCTGNLYDVKGYDVKVEYGSKERKTLSLLIPAGKYHITDLPSYEGTITLKKGQTAYIALVPSAKAPAYSELPALAAKAEKERSEIASTVSLSTPEEWLNPLGGALAIAADGIWSGSAWLHGSIGWRTPHLGWRGAYVGDAIGLHDRALTHFDTYAANQITDIPATLPHPQQDSTLNLARAAKEWGTPMYSTGYICRRPGKKDEMSHYDMNLVYVDALLRHFRHTGDTTSMRRLFPVIKRHLDWEKLNYDPDGDHLYDAYCCIWASDALYYSGGSVTHSSAYNQFANALAAQVAEAIGEDPTPYRQEAEAIREAIDSVLWMPELGHWAEYRDYGGHQRLHPSAAVWTIYHAIDSEIADPFKAYAATCYIDNNIPRIPINSADGEEGLFVISTTNWKPYSWSINNVAIAEELHTALAYWQAGRSEEAYNLMKSVAKDNMYLGASPLNFGQISYYDAARGECYRDFADPIGVWSRALTEGLFGIRPDLLSSKPRVEIIPGFPAEWDSASISLPDISYSFHRTAGEIRWKIDNRYGKNSATILTIPTTGVKSVTVNGQPVEWRSTPDAIGTPKITIDAGTEPEIDIIVLTKPLSEPTPTGEVRVEGPVRFTQVEADGLKWWLPEVTPLKESTAAVSRGFDHVRPERLVTTDLSGVYNAKVTDIFRNEYLSPRPPVTTLQLPKQGIGEWCHPNTTADIDDSGLRNLLSSKRNLLTTDTGLTFSMPSEGDNVIFTSLWDNYPDSVTIPLSGHASHLYIVVAGSTNHMQANIENALIVIDYTDGLREVTPLVNPVNYAPIEQDFYNDDHAFALEEGQLPPYRLHLMSGKMSRNLGKELNIKGVDGRRIPGGAAVVLDIPTDPSRQIKSLTLETLSGDVVAGIMAITLQRP